MLAGPLQGIAPRHWVLPEVVWVPAADGQRRPVWEHKRPTPLPRGEINSEMCFILYGAAPSKISLRLALLESALFSSLP